MTAEQLHDALGMLPSDLIAEADTWRSRPRKPVIQWRRWTAIAACAVLVFGSGFAAIRSGLLGFSGGSTEKLALAEDMAAAECAPEAPAAAAPTEAAGNSCDRSSQNVAEAEENLEPTYGTPPVDTGAAAFYFGELSITDEVYLITEPATVEALGLDADIYDEYWFADFDLLLIALPGITSSEGLDFSVGQGTSSAEWEIHIRNLPEARVDTGDALLICIPVQKGHIPRDAAFTLIFD